LGFTGEVGEGSISLKVESKIVGRGGLIMATENKTAVAAKVFTFLDDEIRAGTGDIILPGSEQLSGVVKRYEVGGENRMHTHPAEDHTFYILQGESTFHFEKDENAVVAKQYDAIFLPKGAGYWFESSGEEKLIILRAGTQTGSDRIIEGRLIPSNRTPETGVYVQPRELPF
jgi:quercetin dioxygenase-like cupin family protein